MKSFSRLASLVSLTGLLLLACSAEQPWRLRSPDAAAKDGRAPLVPDAARDTGWERQRADAGSISADVQRQFLDGPGSLCGNSKIDPGEQCDDGNALSNDGCSSTCQLECTDFECTWPPIRTPVAICGDGRRTTNEACDDGNMQAGDGCSADCTSIESGWRCPAPGRHCTPICGDLVKMGSEECEDGNVQDGDGCSSTCLTEPGWDCSSGTCVPIASDGGTGSDYRRCGDGIISGAEECDDGALNDDSTYGGCSTRCRFIACGDGVVNGPEECDLGARNGLDPGQNGCTIACMRPHYCGDGNVDTSLGEECDLGARNGLLLDSSGIPSDAPGAHCLCDRQCRLCEGILY